MHSDEEYTEIK